MRDAPVSGDVISFEMSGGIGIAVSFDAHGNAIGQQTFAAASVHGRPMTADEFKASIEAAVAAAEAAEAAAANSVDVFNGNDPMGPGVQGGLPDFGDDGP